MWKIFVGVEMPQVEVCLPQRGCGNLPNEIRPVQRIQRVFPLRQVRLRKRAAGDEKFSRCESLGVPAGNPVRALTQLVGGDLLGGESGAASTETFITAARFTWESGIGPTSH